ncbi:hypothetical protein BDP67DRAFT_279310 [Colletotrichum lupini]|nr:hypothetical protein BDP67DRAFT_279310 [Colletotrichum lupini]
MIQIGFATAWALDPSRLPPTVSFFCALLQKFGQESTNVSQTKPKRGHERHCSFGPPLYVPLFICKVLWGICWYTKNSVTKERELERKK